MLEGLLAGEIAFAVARLLDYYLSRPGGIFYIYEKPLNSLPGVLASKETSRYLAAIELLAGYRQAREKLRFVAEWFNSNRNERGNWDLGSEVKDGVYFPLSDSWRKQRAAEGLR